MRKTIPVSALIGGVSTQPEATRPAQQAQDSVNTLGTVIEGLRKRPPGTLKSRLDVRLPATAAYHDINYDDYKFLVGMDTDGALRVWDVSTGASETVYRPDGQPLQAGDVPYLESATPRESLKFLPLADYTLLLNREKTVAASTDLHIQTRKEAVVTVLQGGYAGVYTIEVTDRATGTGGRCTVKTRSSDGTAQNGTVPVLSNNETEVYWAELSAQTDNIARLLGYVLGGGDIGLLAANDQPLIENPAGLDSSWTVEVHGPNILIRNDNGRDFDVTVEESIGDSAMNLTHKEVQLFTELPSSSPVGMKVKVIGDPEQNSDPYWVEFRPHDSELDNISSHGTWARGYWQETVAPGISKGMNPDTLPHALIRGPGGWVLTPLNGDVSTGVALATSLTELPKWDERLVGDLKTNKDPAFVGEKIRDIVFHEGRLAVLGRQTLSMSEVREPFSFYRTSILSLLASDRIFMNTPIQTNETLNHVATLGSDIVIMSEETQYLVRSSDGAFAPATIFVTAAGKHDADPVAPPVVLNSQLFVPRSTGSYGSVSGLVVRGDQRPVLESFDLTGGVPKWLPEPYRLATSPMLDLAFLVADNGNSLYVYAEFYNGGEKRHQSWQKWQIPSISAIHHIWLDETELRIVGAHNGDPEKLHVLEFKMEHNATDTGEPMMMMDNRKLLAPGTGTYSDVTDRTTYALDFDLTPPVAREAVTRKRVRVDLGASSAGSLLLVGDTTAKNVWVGEPLAMQHTLSRIKDTDSQGVPISHGALRLDTGAVQYDSTGEFEIALNDNFNNRYLSVFNGSYLGQGGSYSEGRLSSGVLEFPIRARALDIRIEFTSSGTEPVRLISMDIEARRVRGASGNRGQ
tara:strand:- start:20921 stop:23494 length:2574 start_codon:yes stop_codon:yes gene_type:complete